MTPSGREQFPRRTSRPTAGRVATCVRAGADAGGAIERDTGRVERVHDLEQPAVGAVLLADDDGAPGRAWTGSHELVPVRIVSASRPRGGCAARRARRALLVADDQVGRRMAFGQGAIMSMLGPKFVAALTTLTWRPSATVTSEVGSFSAVALATLLVEDAATGAPTPKSCIDLQRAAAQRKNRDRTRKRLVPRHQARRGSKL